MDETQGAPPRLVELAGGLVVELLGRPSSWPEAPLYVAARVLHDHADGGRCHLAIALYDDVRARGTGGLWDLRCADPLTVWPSVILPCGLHGLIDGGRFLAVPSRIPAADVGPGE